MGIEFIETTTRTVKKGWDRAKERLSRTDLFTPKPRKRRTIEFAPCDEARLSTSGFYILRGLNEQIEIYADNCRVGVCDCPPMSLVQEICANGGIGLGRLTRISEITGMIELELQIELVR